MTAIDYFYVRLLLQTTFSLIVVLVCSYKIITAPDDDGQRPVYWSALSGTAASWMPSPVRNPEEKPIIDDFDKQITRIDRKPVDPPEKD